MYNLEYGKGIILAGNICVFKILQGGNRQF